MNRLRGAGAELASLCETASSASLARVNDIASQLSQTDAFSDGVTVPFAVTAGMTATRSSVYVVSAGLADLFAAAISMGLGAYLAAATESKHHDVVEEKERLCFRGGTRAPDERLYEVFRRHGVPREEASGAVNCLCANEALAVQFGRLVAIPAWQWADTVQYLTWSTGRTRRGRR